METRPEQGIDELIAELAQARKRVATLDNAHPAVLSDLGDFDSFLREVRGRTSPE